MSFRGFFKEYGWEDPWKRKYPNKHVWSVEGAWKKIAKNQGLWFRGSLKQFSKKTSFKAWGSLKKKNPQKIYVLWFLEKNVKHTKNDLKI